MRGVFQYKKYAAGNPDLAEYYGEEDAVALRDHYENFGHAEQRGVDLASYFRLEGMLLSDEGDIFLTGWADRRFFSELHIILDIGYFRYDFGIADVSWYYREDVSHLILDPHNDAGFNVVLKIDDLVPHSRVDVVINNRVVRTESLVRWQSADVFLQQVLGALAVLADRPVGESFGYAEKIRPAMAAVWQRYLNRLEFLRAFRCGRTDGIRLSILIVLYRTADMLIPQLREFEEILSRDDVEVVIVGNALGRTDRLVEELWALSQIQTMNVSLYLCSGNSGFSAANNFAAEAASGEILVLMNPDVFPPENVTCDTWSFLETDPGDGLVGAVLYYGNGSLMHSGMYVVRDLAIDPRTAMAHEVMRVEHFGKGVVHTIDEDAAAVTRALASVRQDVCLVSAALWKIRKEVFFENGGLPTDYIFAYYEDADFCLRFRQAGGSVSVDERARFIHMEGVSKDTPPAVRTFMWLNRHLFSERFSGSALVVDTSADLDLL